LADVFVSYSRRDAAFVRRLVDALESRGKDVWVDIEGIRDAEVFPAALRNAVERSDGFVFVISPDSVASRFCEQEVAHAVELNKRIVPLLLHAVPDDEVPDGIRVRNWIPAGAEDEFEPAVERLVGALDTDLEWTKEHTRWLLKALEWEEEGRDRSFLLRGAELAAAERWLSSAADKEPQPIALQTEYVVASRIAASRRQRVLVGASLGVAAVAVALLVFALISRSQAINARNTARSRALAAESQTQLAVDPERSILLAVAAVHQAKTPEALFAVRGALDASPIRFRLPDAGIQSCGFVNFTAPGIAFSPDGRQLAEGLCSGDVVLADGSTGRVTRRIHVGRVSASVAYNPAGSLLAASSLGAGVQLIDPGTGAVRMRAPGLHPQGRMRMAFSPTAPLLAAAGNGQVTLWNTRTRRTRVLRFPPAALSAPTNALAFSDDGKRLAVGLEQIGPASVGLLVLDVETGRTLVTAATAAGDVAFAPDGSQIAAAETEPRGGGGTIVLLDARTLARRRTLAELPGVEATAVAFSPDGSRVAFGGADGSAGLVAAATGQRIASYLGQTAAVNQVAFSPDGRLLATASTDGTARVWRATGQASAEMRAGGDVLTLETPGDGIETIYADRAQTGGFVVQKWSRRGARVGGPLEISATLTADAAFLSGDGRFAGVIPGGQPNAPIQIWNVSRRRMVGTVPPSVAPFGGLPVFSPDGSSIAMGKPGEGDIAVRGPGPRHGPPPSAPRSGPPPGLPRPAMVVVDAHRGKTRRLGTTSCGTGWRSQPFSRDGKLLAAGTFCGQVYVWEIASGRPVGHPFSIGGELARIAFSPDAKQIAVASWNSTITIADVRTGNVVSVLTDHTKGVPDVAYSPDGRYLASASLDGTARIWDARTLRLLRILVHPDPVYQVRFTPDSREVVTADGAQVIRVWDACAACGDRSALLRLAQSQVTRQLTTQERRTFLGQ
jgi:WD40 repeat protein